MTVYKNTCIQREHDLDNEHGNKFIIVLEILFLIMSSLCTYYFKLSLSNHTFMGIKQTTWI